MEVAVKRVEQMIYIEMACVGRGGAALIAESPKGPRTAHSAESTPDLRKNLSIGLGICLTSQERGVL